MKKETTTLKAKFLAALKGIIIAAFCLEPLAITMHSLGFFRF